MTQKKIEVPTRLTFQNSIDFVRNLRALKPHKESEFDFSNLNTIDPFSLLLVSSEIQRCRSRFEESNNVEDFDDLIMNSISTNLAKNYYQQIDSAIDVDFSNSENLSNSISDILEDAEVNVVNEVDLQILKIYGETSIASSNYWFNGNNHSKKKTSKTAWPDWVKADGKGAAGASITWAVGASMASGPVAPATYFVTVGLAGALASMMS